MFFATTEEGQRVSALNANKASAYYCPLCHGIVVVKQGSKKVWHFAHKNKVDCDADFKTPDMSEWHLVRQSLFHERCQEVTVEDKKTGERHRADVLIYNKYVIEFQHSPISSEEFDRRNEFYNRCGYKVIWVFDLSKVIVHLTMRQLTNTIRVRWKWAWHTWDNCNLSVGNVILLIETHSHTRDELLQLPCWSRVTSGKWDYDPDEHLMEGDLMHEYMMAQKGPPYTYYQSFNEFDIQRYELINRRAFCTPAELDKLTSHCPQCGRLYHKYRFKSKPGYYYKCYHGV